MVAGFFVDAILFVGEGAEGEAEVSVVATPEPETEPELNRTGTVVLVVVASALAKDAAALDNTADDPREKVPLMGMLAELCEVVVVMAEAADVGLTARSTGVSYTSM